MWGNILKDSFFNLAHCVSPVIVSNTTGTLRQDYRITRLKQDKTRSRKLSSGLCFTKASYYGTWITRSNETITGGVNAENYHEALENKFHAKPQTEDAKAQRSKPLC